MFTLEALTQARRSTYTYEDIEFYAKQAAEGHYEGIPDDFDEFIKDKAPTNREELILWLYVCLTRNGLTGYFSRNANPKQPLNKSHIDFLYDAFFEEVQDCIVLGNRKGGKTLVFAALLLLEALFKPGIELAHLGAIKDQATRCYRYFLKMLKHSLFAGMLAKPPTATRTELINGSVVEILVGTITGVNCLHGDSLIECARDVEKYPNGIPIKDLVDKEVVVPTIHEKTGEVQYRKAKGIHSGKSKCVKVTVKSKDVTGKDKLDEVICTPEHPFLMLESRKYRKAYSLRPGDRLVPFDPPYVRDVEDIDTRFTKERRILLPQSWGKSDVTFRAEHREIAKAIFGRDVVNADVVVHHKDGRRLNNDPANLEVLDSLTHHKLHFGEDSQRFITPESLKKMSKSRTRHGVEPVWQNRDWLEAQIKEGKSIRVIANDLNVAWQTIDKWVRRHDLEVTYQRYVIPARPSNQPRGPYKKKKSSKFPWQGKDWLQTEVDQKSLDQIAEEQSCTVSTLRHWCTKLEIDLPRSKFDRFAAHDYDNVDILRKDVEQGMTLKEMGEKYGLSESVMSIKIKKMGLRDARPVNKALHRNKEWLQEQVDKGLSQSQMAELAGCAQTQIGVYIRKYGISKSQPTPLPLYRDKEYLIEQLEQGISMGQIARNIGCSLSAVQNGIKRLGLRHVIESREAEKKHLDKKWLVDQLRQGRTVTEIAREIGCSQSAVSLQMKKFGFTAKQLKDNPEAYYENHVVVSVEWLEGEHDVYDLSVIPEEGDGDYRHNFPLPLGVWISNSPHPHKSQLDEVELMDWAVLQEALNMASSSGGYTGATRLTSTRKYSTGTMQQILDEADAKGFKVYQWNIWDTVEPCQIPKGVESFKVLKEEADETQAIYYVSKECLSCDLVNVCAGKARYSQGGIIPLKDALRNFKNLDKETWDAQVECLKPGTSDLLFPMFNPNVHVINYETVLKRRGLWESASSNCTSFGVCYNPNAEVLAGQDAGYGCPATVFGQMLDDETVVIFDEVYEHNLAPSILINEFLLPRDSEYYVQQWCCDPSGMQLIAEMEIQGLLAMQANNNIATGLDLIRSLLATKRLYITDNCVNLIQELKTYKKTRMGKVAPNQEDHAADAMRYLLMEMGLFTGIVDEVVMGAGS